MDLIERKAVIEALLDKGQQSKRYKLGDIWELNFNEIREAIATVPSVSRWNILKEKINEIKKHPTDPNSVIMVNIAPMLGALEMSVKNLEWIIEETDGQNDEELNAKLENYLDFIWGIKTDYDYVHQDKIQKLHVDDFCSKAERRSDE